MLWPLENDSLELSLDFPGSRVNVADKCLVHSNLTAQVENVWISSCRVDSGGNSIDLSHKFPIKKRRKKPNTQASWPLLFSVQIQLVYQLMFSSSEEIWGGWTDSHLQGSLIARTGLVSIFSMFFKNSGHYQIIRIFSVIMVSKRNISTFHKLLQEILVVPTNERVFSAEQNCNIDSETCS